MSLANDPWAALRSFTEARIGLGRSGAGLPTREVLKFSMAHARARDAVTTPIDWAPLKQGIEELGLQAICIHSAAGDRDTYLRRPDLGRRLSPQARQQLTLLASTRSDLLIVVGDGLSSTGVALNAVPMIKALLPYCAKGSWSIAPVLLASQARVALGDDAGEFLAARAVLVLIGERPGLSSPDSLGAYLTLGPRVGRKDGERNCISNIRTGGLSTDEAAFKAAWLLKEALKRGLTGVQLKDESNYQLDAPASRPELGAR